MGGKSSSTQTQSSTTAPWEPAQGALTGILGQLNGNLTKTGLTGNESGALDTIQNNASGVNQYAPGVGNYISSLFNGGGATDQAGNINQNYLNYQKNVGPLASNTNYDPMQTPGIGTQLQSLQDQITQNVNGQFAAAGRDFSGYNQKALGSGLASGLAPILTAQYNQNVQNQQGAAGNLYNAGNTNAGLLAGLQQQKLANQGQGIGAITAGQDALNSGASNTLAAEAQRRGIPVQALGMLAQIGIPIAGLGGTSTGTSNTENQMSGVQQFMGIMNGIGSLGNLWGKK